MNEARLPGVSVIVMAYDEIGNLDPVVREIAQELSLHSNSSEIIIIDDGSKDGTGAAADRLSSEITIARVIHHPENMGLGGVYRTGLSEAKKDFITFFPADGQFPASIIGQFLPLMSSTDLILGYLPERHDSFFFKMLSGCERIFYSLLFGGFPKFQGIFMIRKEVLDQIRLQSSGRGWAIVMELILRARNMGFRVQSEPTGWRPRKTGHSKVSNLRTIVSNTRQMLGLRQLMRT